MMEDARIGVLVFEFGRENFLSWNWHEEHDEYWKLLLLQVVLIRWLFNFFALHAFLEDAL